MSTPEGFDLPGIASEADAEILSAETIEAAEVSPDAVSGASTSAELGYYEAELSSLRDAALALNEAERNWG